MMRKDPDAVALRLKRPFGLVLVLAVVFLVLIAGTVEAVFRTSFVQTRLPMPSLGTGAPQFEFEWARLRSLVAQEGPVDCILLGNSMIRKGIDPEIFAQAYEAQTGTRIRCSDFSMAAGGARAMAGLTEILAQDYQPRLVVFGITWDDDEQSKRLVASPWFRSQLGYPSLDSLLIDHSLAYRYYLLFLDRLNTPDLYSRKQQWADRTNKGGYAPSYTAFAKIQTPPDPVEEAAIIGATNRLLVPRDEYYAGLDELLRQRDRTQIIAIEMPVHPTFMYYLKGGEAQYADLIDTAGTYLEQRGVPFWPTRQLQMIPDSGWYDRQHMNDTGARIFSQWLGTRVGQAVKQGLIQDPTR